MNKLTSYTYSLILFTCVTCWPVLDSHAQLVIDDFSDGDTSLTNTTNGTSVDRDGPLTGVVDNGYREIQVRNFGPNQGTGNTATVSSGVFSGVRGPGPDTFDFFIQYTGIEFPENGTWDFTGLIDQNAMEFSFDTNTSASLNAGVQVAKWDAGFSNFTQSAFVSAPVTVTGGSSTVSVDLTSLDLATFGPIDAINIGFSYDFDGGFNETINQSFTLTRIAAVPEPSSATLLAVVGLMGLMAKRQRR